MICTWVWWTSTSTRLRHCLKWGNFSFPYNCCNWINHCVQWPSDLPMLTRWQVHFFLLTEFLIQDQRDCVGLGSKSYPLYLFTSFFIFMFIAQYIQLPFFVFALNFLLAILPQVCHWLRWESSPQLVKRWAKREDGVQSTKHNGREHTLLWRLDTTSVQCTMEERVFFTRALFF